MPDDPIGLIKSVLDDYMKRNENGWSDMIAEFFDDPVNSVALRAAVVGSSPEVAALREFLASASDACRPILTPDEAASWPLVSAVEVIIDQRAEYRDDAMRLRSEVAALRRERDELRATLDRIVSVVRSKCDWSWTDQAMVNASLAEAERLLNRNPTGDDHG